ncbi:MAG: IS110 family transposase [Microbacterium sp.]
MFAGIDWGGTFHQLCLLDADGQTLRQQRVAHTVAGIDELCRLLTGHEGAVRVAIERAEGLLVERLLALPRVEVFCVSPKISSRARERYRLAATKSDAFDAFVLADTLRHEHTFWRPIRPASDTLMQLRATIRDRERVVWNQRDLENQLRATMDAYNPAVLHLFSSLDRDISLEFIRRYPLPAQAARVGIARMDAFIRREHYSGRTAAETLVDRIRPHLLSASTGTNQGKAFTAVRFADQLALLNRHLRDYDAEIARLLARHPDTHIFTSFPGIGPVTAATLLAGMGEDRARFPSAPSFLAEAGLAPVTRASGRTRQVRFRYAANKRMRHAIDWWTFVAVREDPHWSGVLYTTARASGQGHHRALRGIAARWSRILWRCWHDNTDYDPTLHPHRREALRTTALAIAS